MLPGQDRGRARQPRLGIVDIYDLDRQRQLILLRRDNVEHLLLIGGPNDVVIETNIVRIPGARLGGPGEAAVAEPLPESPGRPVIEAPRHGIAPGLGDGPGLAGPHAPPAEGDFDELTAVVRPPGASVAPALKPDTVGLSRPAARDPSQAATPMPVRPAPTPVQPTPPRPPETRRPQAPTADRNGSPPEQYRPSAPTPTAPPQ